MTPKAKARQLVANLKNLTAAERQFWLKEIRLWRPS
jgi:hypothetical protein